MHLHLTQFHGWGPEGKAWDLEDDARWKIMSGFKVTYPKDGVEKVLQKVFGQG